MGDALRAEKIAPVELVSDHKWDMRYLMRALIKYNASDLHLKSGRPPLYRIHGKLIPAKMPTLEQDSIRGLFADLLSEQQLKDLDRRMQVDFSFQVKDLGRFRCNVYHQRGGLAAAIRMIPMAVPRLDQLGVPSVVKELCGRPRGLVLVTGATGCGKSTTLSAMIQYINEHRYAHVLTIEDPIEFVYKDDKASITQREIGSDTLSFADALKSGLRQDPDIIVVGELQDIDTIRVALTAAETGHLVLSTLHTCDAKSTIERILDVFPGEAQNQVRIQLASTLVAVVSQQLLMRADGTGRVLASEVMIKSPTVESYILKNEIDKINDAMVHSSSYYKMQTLNQDLERLVTTGIVSLEEALKVSTQPDELKLRLSGISITNMS